MREFFTKIKEANRQTVYFYLVAAIYIIAMLWATLQPYARLQYSRSDVKPIVIQTQSQQTEP